MTASVPTPSNPRAADQEQLLEGRAATIPRSKRVAIGTIIVCTLAIGASYGSAFMNGGAPRWAAWVFSLGMTGVLLGTLALGAIRQDSGLGKLVVPFAAMALLLGGGLAAALALPDNLGAAEPLLLGMPRRAAIVLYIVGLLPTVVLPVAYALTFADQTLRPGDLARIVATARVQRTDDAR